MKEKFAAVGSLVVSGILSEQSMRGLRVTPVQLGDVHAGRPAAVVVLGNTVEAVAETAHGIARL